MTSVRRRLTKNRPGLPEKSSEIPSTSLLVKRERRPKDPAAHKLNGAVASVAFSEVVAATACTRAGSSLSRFLPTDGKQQSRLGLVTLTQDASIPASSRLRAVGVTASPHFYDGFDAVLARRRCKRDNGSFRTALFSVLFCVFVHATHFIASPHSPVIGRLPETVKYLTGNLFQSSRLSFSSTGSLRRSLRCVFLSYLTTDASNFQSAPDPSGGRGRWQWSPLVAITGTAQPVLSG